MVGRSGVSSSSRAAPRKSRRVEPWLATLLAISVLSALSMNAVRPMIAYRALDLGGGPLEVGLIAASFSILSVGAALPIGRWIDRIGAGRFMVGGMALLALTSLATVWIDSLLALAVAYALMGLGQTINLIAGQTAVANLGGRSGRDERYGLYTTAVSIGQLTGPAIAGFLVTGSVLSLVGITTSNRQAPAFVLGAAATAIAACLAVALARHKREPTTSAAPEQPEPATTMMGAAWRVLRRPGMWQAMFVSIVVVSSIDVLIAYLPVYGEANGLSVGLVGALLSVRAGASFTSRLFMSRLIRVLGRRVLLTLGLGLAGLGMVLLSIAPAPWVLVILMVMIGLGLGIGQPITIAWVAGESPRAERATALSLRLTGNRVALLGVPVAVGMVAGLAGVTVIFVAVAALIGFGAATAVSTSFHEQNRGPT